jgi:hypothetical protein
MLIDVASELTDVVLVGGAGGVAPVGHGEHAGEVDGLRVDNDRRDRVTG